MTLFICALLVCIEKQKPGRRDRERRNQKKEREERKEQKREEYGDCYKIISFFNFQLIQLFFE